MRRTANLASEELLEFDPVFPDIVEQAKRAGSLSQPLVAARGPEKLLGKSGDLPQMLGQQLPSRSWMVISQVIRVGMCEIRHSPKALSHVYVPGRRSSQNSKMPKAAK
jgi:hypothetical protein